MTADLTQAFSPLGSCTFTTHTSVTSPKSKKHCYSLILDFVSKLQGVRNSLLGDGKVTRNAFLAALCRLQAKKKESRNEFDFPKWDSYISALGGAAACHCSKANFGSAFANAVSSNLEQGKSIMRNWYYSSSTSFRNVLFEQGLLRKMSFTAWWNRWDKNNAAVCLQVPRKIMISFFVKYHREQLDRSKSKQRVLALFLPVFFLPFHSYWHTALRRHKADSAFCASELL